MGHRARFSCLVLFLISMPALWAHEAPSEPPAETEDSFLRTRMRNGFERPWRRYTEFFTKESAKPTFAARLESFRRKYGLPLAFESKVAPSAVGMAHLEIPGPCGGGSVFFVEKLPRDSQVMATDEVVELDAEGRVFRRWPFSLDLYLLGVAGDEILTNWSAQPAGRTELEVVLAIRPDGSLRVTGRAPLPAADWYPCPTETQLPADGDRVCLRLRDKASGLDRRFAYVPPCT